MLSELLEYELYTNAEKSFYNRMNMDRAYTVDSWLNEKWGLTDINVFWGESGDPELPLSDGESCYSAEVLGVNVGKELTAVLTRDVCGGSPSYLLFENRLEI
tara:strand:- start:862 stop:1167 length:306 start_codon:yes stop_codon:yes gene_type:complete